MKRRRTSWIERKRSAGHSGSAYNPRTQKAEEENCHEFEVNVGYIMSFRLAWYMEKDPVLDLKTTTL